MHLADESFALEPADSERMKDLDGKQCAAGAIEAILAALRDGWAHNVYDGADLSEIVERLRVRRN